MFSNIYYTWLLQSHLLDSNVPSIMRKSLITILQASSSNSLSHFSTNFPQSSDHNVGLLLICVLDKCLSPVEFKHCEVRKLSVITESLKPKTGPDIESVIGWIKASLLSQIVKNPPAMRESWVQSWVGQIPWKRAWQPAPVLLPRESPWTEEPGGLQSIGHTTERLSTAQQRFQQEGQTLGLWAENPENQCSVLSRDNFMVFLI